MALEAWSSHTYSLTQLEQNCYFRIALLVGNYVVVLHLKLQSALEHQGEPLEHQGELSALVEDIVLHKEALVDQGRVDTWLTQEEEEHKEHKAEELVVPKEQEPPYSSLLVDLEEDRLVHTAEMDSHQLVEQKQGRWALLKLEGPEAQ